MPSTILTIIQSPTAMFILGALLGAILGAAVTLFWILWIGMTVDAHR